MEPNSTILHSLDVYPHSVDAVVPLILEILEPRSVVDFGCGVGSWLDGFRRRGVEDFLGIDAPYISAKIVIPQEKFLPWDLEQISDLRLDRVFDLALCLECAEHLEEQTSIQLIDILCQVAPHVVFSAALPGQRGMGHKNEQYPEYWQKLFARNGYRMFDPFRNLLWNKREVEVWYRQNLFLFSKSDRFKRKVPLWDGNVYIAPELFDRYVWALNSVNQQQLIRKERIEKLEALCGFTSRDHFRAGIKHCVAGGKGVLPSWIKTLLQRLVIVVRSRS